jgi:hypothetical protein
MQWMTVQLIFAWAVSYTHKLFMKSTTIGKLECLILENIFILVNLCGAPLVWRKYGAMTFSITTPSITTLRKMTFSITVI